MLLDPLIIKVIGHCSAAHLYTAQKYRDIRPGGGCTLFTDHRIYPP